MITETGATLLIVTGSVCTFMSGTLVGHWWWPKPTPPQPPPQPTIDLTPPTRWHNPADFKCSVCTHRPKQHYSDIDYRYPRRMFGVEMIRMGCGERGCLCGQTQEQVMEAAEKWSFEPPSASALWAEEL